MPLRFKLLHRLACHGISRGMIALAAVLPACVALAQASPEVSSEAPPTDTAIYGQITNVTQRHSAFRSLYRGDNSLDPEKRSAETTDITLFAGLRLWRGAEAWINPEIDQGFGLSNTLGVAGFLSGEAYKVGANKPYGRVPRAFVRQVFELGDTKEKVDAAANQLAGLRSADNITLTIGKFGVTDIFDTNRYAHDPRADFLNWSVIDAGAFDYAADAWGFTYGAAAEWSQGWWTWRGGMFQLSKVPNGKVVAPKTDQYMLVTEFETRHTWMDHPGKVKLLAFVNHGNMANYADAVSLAARTGSVPDVQSVRRFANNPGFALNIEQELTADLGAFARASANSGRKEAYEFTEINRSLSGGLSMRGTSWNRREDTFGLAGVINRLSNDARSYFAAGGMGILIGDGGLNYGTERIVETYYALQVMPSLTLTLNYQHVTNPAYNRDRGPLSAYGLRVHAEF